MGGFLIGAFWEAPILVMVGSIAVGIYLFRFQTPTIPTNQGIITAPVSGKVSAVEQINSPNIASVPPRECDVEINDTLSQGQVFGFLSFGGHMDLYVPSHFSPLRIVKQTCIAGETILAKEA